MAERRTKSDQHKAVRVYHDQLSSIQNGVGKAISDLDQALDEYLKNVSTSISPPRNER